MKKVFAVSGLLMGMFLWSNFIYAQNKIVDSKMYHIRNDEEPEWSDFPQQPEGKQLSFSFIAEENRTIQALHIRQQDVKQPWAILLNGHETGKLTQDENDMILYLEIDPGLLLAGENIIKIEPVNTIADDIRVGEIYLFESPVSLVLSEAFLDIKVIDKDNQLPLPSRITITRKDGALQPVGAESSLNLAVRPGFVYTGNGSASFTLPSGIYNIYAGRGTEYGIDSIQLVLIPGDRMQKKFYIRKEVPVKGWVSSDTHIHTVTYSGHGDATIEERAITIAGEGLELPILTDHNVHVDLSPVAEALNLNTYFTPVIGNEVTTAAGHFNIFPIAPGATVPDYETEDWDILSQNIRKTPDVKAVILNHARDIHRGFRPFDPKNHVGIAGRCLDERAFIANAMEVVNSGAQQNNFMQLYQDWFGLLNRGYKVTPVGASDSHDVGRFLVGQARTYIKGNNEVPGQIDVDEVVRNFAQGKVMVSFGLLTEALIDNEYGPGELAATLGNNLAIQIKVKGPAWVDADQVALYANGIKIREAAIEAEGRSGVKWAETWIVPRPKHDIFLVIIAEGSVKKMPFWPIAKPYQATSPDFHPRVFGSTGAIYVDADGDGKFSSAYEYAQKLFKSSKGNFDHLLEQLASFDKAVAIQVASLLQESGNNLSSADFEEVLQKAAPVVREGFKIFDEEWQLSQKAQND